VLDATRACRQWGLLKQNVVGREPECAVQGDVEPAEERGAEGLERLIAVARKGFDDAGQSAGGESEYVEPAGQRVTLAGV